MTTHNATPKQIRIVVSASDFVENKNDRIGTQAKTIAAALQTKSTSPKPFINPQTTELQSLHSDLQKAYNLDIWSGILKLWARSKTKARAKAKGKANGKANGERKANAKAVVKVEAEAEAEAKAKAKAKARARARAKDNAKAIAAVNVNAEAKAKDPDHLNPKPGIKTPRNWVSASASNLPHNLPKTKVFMPSLKQIKDEPNKDKTSWS